MEGGKKMRSRNFVQKKGGESFRVRKTFADDIQSLVNSTNSFRTLFDPLPHVIRESPSLIPF